MGPNGPQRLGQPNKRSNIGPQRARLTWAVTNPESVRRFDVRIRRGDTIRTAAVIRRPDARELVVERPQRDRVFYRVLAIGENGQVLARSNEVRVTSGDDPVEPPMDLPTLAIDRIDNTTLELSCW